MSSLNSQKYIILSSKREVSHMKYMISDKLQIDPKHLYKYIPYVVDNYTYDFLDNLESNLDINVFYLYMNSLETHQHKNVWNLLCDEWKKLCHRAHKDRGFNRKYGKDSYSYIHRDLEPNEINKLLHTFSNKDIIKQLIVLRTILYHGYPKLRSYEVASNF